MKKLTAMLLAVMCMFVFTACRGDESGGKSSASPSAPATTDEGGESSAAPATPDASAPAETGDASASPSGEEGEIVPNGDYKIGIITGTVSQGEEEFQAAQKMLEKYGSDVIVTSTYPDKFNDETETTIANVVSLASDEKVKAIVFCQAVPGAIAAIQKVRETRPDMLFVAGVAQETPREIAEAADVVMLVDEIGMGTKVIEQAKKMGAETFVHYSFARHLGMETIAARTALFKETCEKEGIKYVEATAPDPTGDAGVSGAQQFILEDVPRKVAEYGTETAFFSTNCSMQEPLIKSVLNQKAIFPQQCCPSPYHGFPAALNISTKGHEGDVQYMLDQTQAKIDEAGMGGRMSTWPMPVNMLMIEAGVDYAIKFCEGQFTEPFDDAQIRASISKIAKAYNATESLSLYKDAEGEIENFYMILCDFYNF